MQFNFSFQTNPDGTPSLSLEQMTAFETAGRIWSAYLKDDVTVNVHVGMSNDLPDNVIGGALPSVQANYKLDQFAQDLAADASSQDDQTVADNLVTKDNLQIWTSPAVNLTTAAAKSLDIGPEDTSSHFYSGFYSDTTTSTVSIESGSDSLTTSTPGQSDALDGVILMSNLDNLSRNQDDITDNDVSWSYPGSSASSSGNRLDFLSVALHELGHILGFVSGADDSSWLLEQITQLQSQAL
ncbi:NF038122 family metalloprotease, partial [Okeania sp. SIO2G5]|uniref:NF038122 family metalloprotease n=1 Tax=Okeania sp. SIO2G5 TaxID=2607796 RepID=UPI0013C1E242